MSINGRPVDERVQELARGTPASTPQALWLRIGMLLLLGQPGTSVELGISGPEEVSDVTLTRKTGQLPMIIRSTPVFSVLPEGFGYIDLARIDAGQLAQAFQAVRNTPGLILDMRGYPNDGLFPVLPAFLGRRTGVAALLARPDPDGLHLDSRPWYRWTESVWAAPRPDAYRGEVVVLINQEAISSAEHTLLHLEATRPVTFIGTPTMGANGNVTSTVLPGGITVIFTGQGVRHADGRQLQRVGVLPDVYVAQTVAGIRAGRDEILEAAVELLRGRGD